MEAISCQAEKLLASQGLHFMELVDWCSTVDNDMRYGELGNKQISRASYIKLQNGVKIT